MSDREEFEAWASKEGWAESDIKDRCALDCPRSDEYRNFGLQDFWEVWQAARKSMKEELAAAKVTHYEECAVIAESCSITGGAAAIRIRAAIADGGEVKMTNACRVYAYAKAKNAPVTIAEIRQRLGLSRVAASSALIGMFRLGSMERVAGRRGTAYEATNYQPQSRYWKNEK